MAERRGDELRNLPLSPADKQDRKVRSQDKGKISRVSMSGRKSKVTLDDLSPNFTPSLRCGEIYKLFPNVLAGRDFKRLVESIVTARRRKAHVVFMIGGHVVKTGVS